MASGYKNHVQHACSLNHRQEIKTSEQQTANLLGDGIKKPCNY